VLVSLGMSNTTQEFKIREAVRGGCGPESEAGGVDCAQGTGGFGMETADRNAVEGAERRLAAAGVTPEQVQVMWLKQADKQPARYGEFPRHAEVLRDNVIGT